MALMANSASPAASSPVVSGPSRRRAWARGVLAGPLAFLTAGVIMAGGTAWLPKGAAQIDNIVLPIGFFPLIWAAVFFYTSLDRKLGRAYLVTFALLLVNAGLAALVYFRAGAAS
jgi:hypothetical protein